MSCPSAVGFSAPSTENVSATSALGRLLLKRKLYFACTASTAVPECLNMLVRTQGGFDYTGAGCIGWMRAAGFAECAAPI
jgi:hypothetical protein